jgi:intein/homing endonuclease
MDEKSFQELKNRSLYAKLKRLFSNDIIVRNIGGKKLKVIDTDEIFYAADRSSLRDRFNRLRTTAYNQYTRDFNLSYQSSRVELFRDYDCVGPDTIIPLPDGTYPTIAELTERYKDKPQERFYVFSYDHKTDSIKLGKAYHPRKKKGTRQGYKVTFDDGKFVIGSLKHPFMMRDGSYKMLYELRVGDSVMPFYQHTNKLGYRSIYNYSHGWVSEHKLIATQFYGKQHSDESNEQRSKTLKEVFVNRNQTGEHNPKYRGDITFSNVKEKALEFYKENSKINLWEFIDHIHCDHSTLQNRLKKEGHDWKSFKQEVETTLNHKIVSIEMIGETDVYDVTVEEYHNFATDSVICGNTMDMDPILASALDIYADECTTRNELGEVITVRSSNDDIKSVLNNLFYDILNIEFNLWSWTRSLAKYGDFYLRMHISPEYGVYMVEPLSSYYVTRVENSHLTNKNFTKFQVNLPYGNKIEDLENYQMAHFRLLNDSNFLPYGKCLAKNSYVDMEFGAKRINEIAVGDKVWTYNVESRTYELSTVLNSIASGDKHTYKISTQHNSIECTDTHPILVYSDDVFVYKNAGDLAITDLLVLNNKSMSSRADIKLSTDFITTSNHNGWKSDITSLPVNPTNDFMEFFGFMFGDGWLNKAMDTVCFARGVNLELNDKYTTLLEKFANKQSRLIEGGENSGDQSVVGSKMLAEFLYINGFKGKATTKRIPYWVFQLSESLQLSFINGLVDADGSIFTDKWNSNRYSLELNNKTLVEDVKCMISRLGFKCSNVKERGFDGETIICGTTCNRTKSYYIYFYLDGLKKTQLHKYSHIGCDSVILDPIKSIESIGIQPTYDIQVESENSNFVANGIVVHNSMLEGARRVWKQLSLMEDAMLIHRIMRAPEKRIFKVDIGNIPPNEVDNHMERLIQQMKKTPYLDQNTGDYNLRFNLQNMVEDFFLPVRGGDSGTNIENLPGLEWTGTDDIEYLRNKMMAALKIPKAFLGYDEALSGKATLAAEDIRFARTIQRVQRIIVSELNKIAVVHLYSQGYRDEALVDFTLELTNPSTIFEKEKIDVWKSKVEVSKDMQEQKLFSKKWIYDNVFGMSDQDMIVLQKELVDDAKGMYRFKQIEEEGNDPALEFLKAKGDGEAGGEGGGDESGGGGGGSPGGDEAGGEAGAGGEAAGGADASAAPAGGEAPKLTERDQTGRKKARDYPFGEDPLGTLEINSRSDLRPAHKYRKKSPLSLESMESLATALKSVDGQKEILREGQEKSFMDETNIKE